MKINCTIIYLFIIFLPQGLHAQNQVDGYNIFDYTKNIPPPPTSAALGRYGESPISYFTGRPEISIPLYTIKDFDFSLPISLTYNASGIKISEVASWVGLGWSLNAGGVITRTIRGLADEINYNGFLSNAGVDIQGDLIHGICKWCNIDTSSIDFLPLWKITSNLMDGLPDIYYFNFGNYSGKFIFDYNGNIYQIPNNPLIKIIPYRDSLPTGAGEYRHIHAFDIITEDGTRYKFGDDATEKTSYWISYAYQSSVYQFTHNDYSNNLYVPNLPSEDHENTPYNNSWYLYKIILPNSIDSILFSYATDSISYIPSWDDTFLYGMPEMSPSDSTYWLQILRSHTLYGVLSKRLIGISWKEGTISFVENNDSRIDVAPYNNSSNVSSFALSKIVIKNILNQTIQSITLNTSYFIDTLVSFWW